MAKIPISPNIRKRLKDQIEEILTRQAKRDETISYGKLCREVSCFKIEPNDSLLHSLLGEISRNSHQSGKGMLSVFVVKSDSGIPGDGFFKEAKKLGYSFTSKESFFEDHIKLVHRKYKEKGILTV